MAGSGVRGAIAGTVVFLAALIAAMAGMMLVAPFGLTVPEAVVWPLAVGFGALVAALAGGWAANAVAVDRSRSRFYAISGATEAAAVLVIIVTSVLRLTAARAVVPNLFSLIVITAAVLALIVNAVVWRYRGETSSLRRDLTTTTGLLALGIVLVITGITVTCAVTTCTP